MININHWQQDKGGEILRLRGLDSDFTRHLDLLGGGYLVVSNYGVDLVIQHEQLSPTRITNDECLWWPEAGIQINTESLRAVYAKQRSVIGAGSIECDFDSKSNGFSILYSASKSDVAIFELVTEAYAESTVKAKSLEKKRRLNTPQFNICPCCADRAERIRAETERHPVCQLMEDIKTQGIKVEFHLSTAYSDVLTEWRVDGVESEAGVVSVIGQNHILRIDAAMIHVMQISHTKRKGRIRSVLRCHHSLGGLMLEMSISGSEHADHWHKICRSEGFSQ